MTALSPGLILNVFIVCHLCITWSVIVHSICSWCFLTVSFCFLKMVQLNEHKHSSHFTLPFPKHRRLEKSMNNYIHITSQMLTDNLTPLQIKKQTNKAEKKKRRLDQYMRMDPHSECFVDIFLMNSHYFTYSLALFQSHFATIRDDTGHTRGKICKPPFKNTIRSTTWWLTSRWPRKSKQHTSSLIRSFGHRTSSSPPASD